MAKIYFEIFPGFSIHSLLELLMLLLGWYIVFKTLIITKHLKGTKYFGTFKWISAGTILLGTSVIMTFIDDLANTSIFNTTQAIFSIAGFAVLLIGFRKGFKQKVYLGGAKKDA